MCAQSGAPLCKPKYGCNMSRIRRAYTARAILRMWGYLGRSDRAYIVCWFARIHADKAARLSPARIISGAQKILGTLGLTGTLAGGILTALDLLRPDDLAECDRLIERGLDE